MCLISCVDINQLRTGDTALRFVMVFKNDSCASRRSQSRASQKSCRLIWRLRSLGQQPLPSSDRPDPPLDTICMMMGVPWRSLAGEVLPSSVNVNAPLDTVCMMVGVPWRSLAGEVLPDALGDVLHLVHVAVAQPDQEAELPRVRVGAPHSALRDARLVGDYCVHQRLRSRNRS